mgnify:CR=1 FL=1
MKPKLRATAFAPATVANVGSGFDLLGFAVDGIGDRITVVRETERGVRIRLSAGAPSIPVDPEKNTAGKPLISMLSRYASM